LSPEMAVIDIETDYYFKPDIVVYSKSTLRFGIYGRDQNRKIVMLSCTFKISSFIATPIRSTLKKKSR
jgi:hypothetical protein